MTYRKTGKRGQRCLPKGKGMAGISHPEPVIAGQTGVGASGKDQSKA
jgi:hypothetical protein